MGLIVFKIVYVYNFLLFLFGFKIVIKLFFIFLLWYLLFGILSFELFFVYFILVKGEFLEILNIKWIYIFLFFVVVFNFFKYGSFLWKENIRNDKNVCIISCLR